MREISNLQSFEISSQNIFLIFLIGYNLSPSAHFHFLFQSPLLLFRYDDKLSIKYFKKNTLHVNTKYK